MPHRRKAINEEVSSRIMKNMRIPTGCATRLQQAICVTLMTATSRFIILVSLLAASWSWFQDRKMTNRQRQVQSQFTGKCISLRNPWEADDPTPQTHTQVIGVDVGMRYLAVTSNTKGDCTFHCGKRIVPKANHYARLRK